MLNRQHDRREDKLLNEIAKLLDRNAYLVNRPYPNPVLVETNESTGQIESDEEREARLEVEQWSALG